ncbi:hypothetical protein LTR48_009589, partial [Friedmanniomyces endolithicus]
MTKIKVKINKKNKMAKKIHEKIEFFEKQKEKYKDIEDLADLAEQVKRSAICEILPAATPLPGQAADP